MISLLEQPMRDKNTKSIRNLKKKEKVRIKAKLEKGAKENDNEHQENVDCFDVHMKQGNVHTPKHHNDYYAVINIRQLQIRNKTRKTNPKQRLTENTPIIQN